MLVRQKKDAGGNVVSWAWAPGKKEKVRFLSSLASGGRALTSSLILDRSRRGYTRAFRTAGEPLPGKRLPTALPRPTATARASSGPRRPTSSWASIRIGSSGHHPSMSRSISTSRGPSAVMSCFTPATVLGASGSPARPRGCQPADCKPSFSQATRPVPLPARLLAQV
jgi:hypothetical protein